MSDDVLRALCAECVSYAQVVERLGFKFMSEYYAICRRIRKLKIDVSHFFRGHGNKRNRILKNLTDDLLREACARCTSYSQVMSELGYRGGGSYQVIVNKIVALNIDVSHFSGQGWSKGLTKKSHSSIARLATTLSKSMKGHPGHPGRPHTAKTRQKMSQLASERVSSNRYHAKWYEVINPSDGTVVKVQGTWEKRFAEWLNEKKMKWTRPRAPIFWKKPGDPVMHAYHPDFYLCDTDLYVEIKGCIWHDVAVKLASVVEQNAGLDLVVLTKPHLKRLGVLE